MPQKLQMHQPHPSSKPNGCVSLNRIEKVLLLISLFKPSPKRGYSRKNTQPQVFEPLPCVPRPALAPAPPDVSPTACRRQTSPKKAYRCPKYCKTDHAHPKPRKLAIVGSHACKYLRACTPGYTAMQKDLHQILPCGFLSARNPPTNSNNRSSFQAPKVETASSWMLGAFAWHQLEFEAT